MIVQNFSSGFLSAAITSGTTSVVVNSGSTLPTTNGLFTATIWNNTTYTDPSQDPNAEIVWCQYVSTNTYTITRGMEGTAAVAHPAGSLMGLYITAGVLSIPYVKVSNTQTQNTPGGTATSGSWLTVPLNTKDTDTAAIASIGSNQLTLPAGTYNVNISSPFQNTGNSQIRLYNVTDSSVLLTGTSVESLYGYPTTTVSNIRGQIVLTQTTTLSVQYQVATSISGSGLGGQCNFGPEVYMVAEFTLVNT